MIVKQLSRGQSFKGVTAYLAHDPDHAKTSNRVEWSITGNMHTNDLEKAAKVMAFTAMNADTIKRANGWDGRGGSMTAGAVYHFTLSWAAEETPDKQHQIKSGSEVLDRLGLAEHQYYMAAHNDTDHSHIHIVANLIHPETGKANELKYSKRVMQEWALEYEKEHGLKCELRQENALKREQGEEYENAPKNNRELYAQKATEAFQHSDNAQSFKAALEAAGLSLARGNKRQVVLVDEKGDIYALNRLLKLEGKDKNQLINARLEGLDKDSLEFADVLQKQRGQMTQQDTQDEGKGKAQDIRAELDETRKAANLEKSPTPERDLEDFKAYQERRRNENIEAALKQFDIRKHEQDLEKAETEAERRYSWFEKVQGKHKKAADYAEDMKKNLIDARGRLAEYITKETKDEHQLKFELNRLGLRDAVDKLEALKEADRAGKNGEDQGKGYKPNAYEGRTTQGIAEQAELLAHDPMQNLRGWLDENTQNQEQRGDRKGASQDRLFTGQNGGIKEFDRVRPIPAAHTEKPSGEIAGAGTIGYRNREAANLEKPPLALDSGTQKPAFNKAVYSDRGDPVTQPLEVKPMKSKTEVTPSNTPDYETALMNAYALEQDQIALDIKMDAKKAHYESQEAYRNREQTPEELGAEAEQLSLKAEFETLKRPHLTSLQEWEMNALNESVQNTIAAKQSAIGSPAAPLSEYEALKQKEENSIAEIMAMRELEESQHLENQPTNDNGIDDTGQEQGHSYDIGI